jgi:hypothetical protein
MLKDICKPALLSILSLIPWCMSMPLEGLNDSKRDKNIGIYKSSVSSDAKKKTSRVCFDDHCLSHLVDESDFYHPQLHITQAGKIFCTAFSREVVREAFSRMHHVKNIRNLNRCFAWLCMEVAMEMHVIPTFSVMFALREFHGYQANNSVPFFVVRKEQTVRKAKENALVRQTVVVSDIIPTRFATSNTLEESQRLCERHGFLKELLALQANAQKQVAETVSVKTNHYQPVKIEQRVQNFLALTIQKVQESPSNQYLMDEQEYVRRNTEMLDKKFKRLHSEDTRTKSKTRRHYRRLDE